MDYELAQLKKSKTGDWYVYYTYRDPATGLMAPFKVRLGINRIKVLKEKQRYGTGIANDINNKLKNGWSPFVTASAVKKSATLKVVLLEYLALKKGALRKRSVQHYEHGINLISEFLVKNNIENIRPDQFTNVLAQAYSDFLITVKKHSGKSHNNQILNMGTFFNMMVDREIVVKNPFKVIKKKPVDTGKNLAYSDAQREEIKQYLEVNNPPIYMMVQFIYYCFIRPNELMQLQVKHIDFQGKQIQIPANVSKNRRQSSVEIPSTFFENVKNLYINTPPEHYLFGRGLIPSEISVHRNRATAAHKLILDHLKIKGGHTLYSWKHTGAVAAIKSGMNPYSLMRQLRHSSLDQTMIYLKTLGLTSNEEFASKQPKF